MKLHEAIAKLFEFDCLSLTTNEIAEKLNSNGWYKKKDNSLITAFQIHGRTKNYAHIFKRDRTSVSLHSNPPFSITKPIEPEIIKAKKSPYNTLVLEKYFMNDIYFKPAGVIDNLIPLKRSGLYCIKINDHNSLPKPFNDILIDRNHEVLYIGIAKKCLNTRLLKQELRIMGHGTFIRSLGAVLGFRPEVGSLKNKINKVNYFFNEKDNKILIKWINDNLNVNWIEFSGDLERAEKALINRYRPLLNILKNKSSLFELKDLRAKCIEIAKS